MLFGFKKFKTKLKCFAVQAFLAAFIAAAVFCSSARVLAAEEMPDAADMITAEEIPAQYGALSSANTPTDDSSAVRLEAGSLSGWIIDGSKAKYYDPKTHKAYKDGTYQIKGRTIRFDQKGYALNYASVGKGRMFKRIKDAVKSLITQNPKIASSTVNNTIAYVDIYEGTYQEAINLQSLAGGKGRSASGIYFKGIGTVNWKSPANYPTGCLCGYGAITVENIHFTATSKGSSAAYAYHYEAGKVRFPLSNPGVVFRNCSFRSAGNHAVGIGMGMEYSRLTFRNCEFHGAIRDIYLHNSVYEGADRNQLKFAGCSAKCVYVFDAAKWNADRHSRLILKFKGNDFSRMILDCGNMGENAGRKYSYIPKNYANFEIIASGGNTNRVFDRKGK